MLRAHLFQLRVDRLNALAIPLEIVLVSPVMRGHVFPPNGNDSHARLVQNRLFVWCAVVALIAKDARSAGQRKGQFMDRCEVVITARDHSKTDRESFRGADQMQAPTEESLFLRGE